VSEKKRFENPGIAKIGLTPPPPYPIPGTLVDLTTKVQKLPFLGVNDYFLGKCSLIVGDDPFWGISDHFLGVNYHYLG